MLSYLLSRATLPPHLYRSTHSAYQLLFILLALDAKRKGKPLQETATLLFGRQPLAGGHLGDQAMCADMARAVGRSRSLCDGKFRSLLR